MSGAGHAPTTASKAMLVLAVLAVAVATALALAFAKQPLLDGHSFRQTQTALTAYWFMQEGYRLDYQTPVAGYPWAIPFEFPLFQALAAMLTQITGLPLTVVGRLLSFSFLLLCIPPAVAITRRLALPWPVLTTFVGVTFTAPVYVFWGRAFLIETSALFFGIMAIKCALDYLLGGRAARSLVLFAGFMALCLLQKVTTGLPILMVFAALFVADEVRRRQGQGAAWLGRRVLLCLAVLAPLVSAYAWITFTDHVKLANPLGPSLTSSALAAWNWGTGRQRLTADLWLDVIWQRCIFRAMGGYVGPAMIAGALVMKAEWRIKAVIATSLVLGILPLFLFTNLHIVHDYYQSSNILFLIYALAVALGAVIMPRAGATAGCLFLAALMAANVLSFVQFGYLSAMENNFGPGDRDVAVSRVLSRELPEDGQFVAFGNDYSATYAFLSGRKSFTVPAWFNGLAKVIARPEDYVESGHLGAVVACSDLPDRWQLTRWAEAYGKWKVGEVEGCAIAVPSLPLPIAAKDGACRGVIEKVELAGGGNQKAIVLTGWSAATDDPARPPDAVFADLRSAAGIERTVELLRTPRPDITRILGADENQDFGYSRLLVADLPPGAYNVTIMQRLNGRDIACPASAVLNIP